MMNASKKAVKATVKGQITKFIMGPLNNGYTILSIKTPSGDFIKLSGTNIFNNYKLGDEIQVVGTEDNHPKYGMQINATQVGPVTKDIKEKNILLRWIKPALREEISLKYINKLIEKLGENADQLIFNYDAKAMELIGQNFESLRNCIKFEYCEYHYGTQFIKYKIDKNSRTEIYDFYDERIADVIQNDPYDIVLNIESVDFDKIDQMALHNGIKSNNAMRIKSAAHKNLLKSKNNGHTWQSEDAIIKSTARDTNLSDQEIYNVISDNYWSGSIPVSSENQYGEVVNGWAEEILYNKEYEIAVKLAQKLKDGRKFISKEKALYLVQKYSYQEEIILNEQQEKAAVMALTEPLSIITGNPGTGKTTVLNIIVKCWEEMGVLFGLAAPTGKAAQRMYESTNVKAQTLHRLLGADKNMDQYIYNINNPIPYDIIAVDEGSMMDVNIAHALVKASKHTQILFLGDPDQLASVQAGRILGDMVESKIPKVRLTEIKRQKDDSSIALAAQSIRDGIEPDWFDDMQFIEINDNDKIANKVIEIYKEEKAKNSKMQILTPGHAAQPGTIHLNKELSVKDENLKYVHIGNGLKATIGDKIIQTMNNSENKLFNGDSGEIIDIINIDNKAHIVAKMDGDDENERIFEPKSFFHLNLSHALTVHKAQGSEYDVVIIPMTTTHNMLLKRSLINTAVTRAKKKCIIVGQKNALIKAINNDDSNERNTLLKQHLENLID